MVAYSFKPRFIEPIASGAKRQTIRADRKRHARPGEELQLYTGMRTRHCRLIGRARCWEVDTVRLLLSADRVEQGGHTYFAAPGELDWFARTDGFADWSELRAFWAENHPRADPFSGVLIRWGSLL